MTRCHQDGRDVGSDYFQTINAILAIQGLTEAEALNQSYKEAIAASPFLTEQFALSAEKYIQRTKDPSGEMTAFLERLNNSRKAWDEKIEQLPMDWEI